MSSPIPPVLRAQHPLSKNNDTLTQHEALALRKEVKEVECQRRQLLQDLAIIEAQLASNATRLGYLKPILAPIRRIPLEILGEIFLRVPTSQLHPGNHQKSVLKLLLVCKRWREAVRLTPGLWSHVWVKADDPNISFEVLSAWISRAGNVPKHIEISSSCCGGVDWNYFRSIRCAGRNKCRFANAIFPRLLKQTPGSWRSVSLNCPTPNCLRHFMNSLKAVKESADCVGWDSIQSFEAVASKWVDWKCSHVGVALSSIPASVTEISLHLPPMARQEVIPDRLVFWVMPLNIPLSIAKGLTSLKLRFDAKAVMAPTTLFETLQHCANLETLEVDLSGNLLTCHEADPRNAHFEHHGVSLPKLRNLRLWQIHPKSINAFKLIKIPQLLNMSISFCRDSLVDRDGQTPNFSTDEEDFTATYDGRTLADFIRGDRDSPSTLRSLHLKNLSFFDGALYHSIHDLHSLVHLQLEWAGLPGNADDFLELMEGGPTCLPQLKDIKITRLKHPFDGKIPYLRAFAEGRGVDLKLSVHDRIAWGKDKKRYFHLTGCESDDD